MALYAINGQQVNVDDSIQGQALTDTLTSTANAIAQQNRNKFLNVLGQAEGANYNTIVGGRQVITDFSDHPNVVGLRTADGPSTSAGKYQINAPTWQGIAPQIGVRDFSPISQDKVATELIRQHGALDMVDRGDFQSAMQRLGKVWQSLPSGASANQSKRGQAWFDQAIGQAPTTAPSDNAPAAFSLGQAPGPQATQFQQWATVPQHPTDDDLRKDPGTISASRQLMNSLTRTSFNGSDEDAAQWGLDMMSSFNNNIVAMTSEAAALMLHGSQDDKNAFMYLLQAYDNKDISWSGAGRAALAQITDPTNWMSLGTLGAATVAKIAASKLAKHELIEQMVASLGRTGIQAGIQGGIQGGTSDLITQGVKTDAGAQDSVSLGEVVGHAALGATAGTVLGTSGDMLLSKAIPAVKSAVGKVTEILGMGGKGAAEHVKPPEMVASPQSTGMPPSMPNAPAILTPIQEAERNAAQAGAIVHDPNAPKVETPLTAEIPKDKPVVGTPVAEPSDATGTLPNATSLTADEASVALLKRERDPLWAGEQGTPPLDIPHVAQGAGDVSDTEMLKAGQHVANQLSGMTDSALAETLSILREGNTYTNDQAQAVTMGVNLLRNETQAAKVSLIKRMNAEPKSPEMPNWIAQFDKADAREAEIEKVANRFAGDKGASLRQEQLTAPIYQGSSIESLMAEHGLTRPEAMQKWASLVDASQVSKKAKEIAADYEAQIQAKLDDGDTKGAMSLAVEKRMALNGVAEEATPGGSAFTSILHGAKPEQVAAGAVAHPEGFATKIHHFFGGLRELVISNVFSLKTVMVNLIPSAFKTAVVPAMKFVVTNPLERAARAELGAHYAAMGASIRGALSAAHAAYKFEASFLTRGSGRLMEGEMMMKGRLGGAARFLPRVLNASDELLSHINYAGYVAGKAANQAALDAQERGLTGKALSDFVKQSVEHAKKHMYDGDTDRMLQPVVNKGVNLGLSGPELTDYVQTNAVKYAEALRHGTDQESTDLVRDTLYKRPFSGGNAADGFVKKEASGGAVAIETFLRKAPEFSLLIGQLFFRTPIRVFEEGIRLTPGVQILAPGFMRDLIGTNGVARQVRAQGESLTSLAIAGAALSLYASGRMTGSGVYMNAQQEKNRADTPIQEPYTIRLANGKTWSYKNLDPIATPLKIMMNAFEGMDELKIKEAQEQYTDKPARKLIEARIAVATMAVGMALRDSNLVAGLNGTIQLGKELNDPDGDEAAIIKKFASEMKMLVPNTLHKIAQSNDPRQRDPATWFQAVETALGHNLVKSDVKTSFAYDPLGEYRTPSNIGSMWNTFAMSTQEGRDRGLSSEHAAVMTEMDRLAQVAGVTFKPIPVKNPLTGNLDLRTMNTKDGTETLFDRWNRNYKELGPDKVLYPIAMSNASDGTYIYPGAKPQLMQQAMQALQTAAFARLMQEEEIRARYIKQTINEARAQAGQMDYDNRTK
jgi:muramidase (phage lysozyme)